MPRLPIHPLFFPILPPPNRTHYQDSSPLCTLGFFFFACPPTQPPYHPPLPTPVINFSTAPFFSRVSSLLSLHFPSLFFFPSPSSFLSFLLHLVTKKGGGGVDFTVSAYSRFTKAWYRTRGSATRRHELAASPEFNNLPCLIFRNNCEQS